MNKNTEPNTQNEEVDLGQVFSYIEKFFQKIGKLIANLLKLVLLVIKKVAVFLLLSINIIISKIIFIAIAFIIGLGLAYFIGKTTQNRYRAQMIIQQNFNTGNIISSQISSLDNMAQQADSVGLGATLNIAPELASNITGFSVEHVINKNNVMLEYADFIKESDSIVRLSFDDFLENKSVENLPIKIINVESTDPSVYDSLEKPIYNLIINNQYFDELKEKELKYLQRRKKTINLTLQKSDTLQGNYFKLLEKYYKVDDSNSNNNRPGSDINLNLDGNSKDKINTKEYELFLEASKLRQELDDIESKIEEKADVIIVQKGFSAPSILDKEYYESKLFFPILFAAIVFLIFFFKELSFGSTLGKYGTKEELLKSDK